MKESSKKWNFDAKILCYRFKDVSCYGNPRYYVCFQFALTGCYRILQTALNASVAYGLSDYVGKKVRLECTRRRGEYEIDYINIIK